MAADSTTVPTWNDAWAQWPEWHPSSYSSHHINPDQTPVSNTILPNDYTSYYPPCNVDSAPWDPYNLDAFLSGPAEPEVHKGHASSLMNLPHYSPADSALSDPQLLQMPETSRAAPPIETPRRPSASQTPSSFGLTPERPWPPSPSASGASSPAGGAGNRPSGRKPSKRGRASRRSKSDGGEACPRGTPAAINRHGKAHFRVCHNEVEKNYRSRLSHDFGMLLDVLVDCADDQDLSSVGLTAGTEQSWSKGSILRLARRKLLALQVQDC
ncbi:Helix-loop-helix DNA-binding domain protein [Metarhizium brunneum]